MVFATTMAPNSSFAHPQCYPPMPAVSNGILQGDLPFNFALPLLTMQIAIVLLITRSVAALFRLIKQPRVLAEIIGGVLLGPTALGRNKMYMETVFPLKSLSLLETVATIGVMFFIFMVGLELDINSLRKTGKKALALAASGILLPFMASIGLVALVRTTIAKGVQMAPLLIFMGVPLSVSSFSVLVRIMAELKLLSTDMAKLAVPIGAINDVTIWSLLAVGVATSGSKKSPLTPIWVILSAFGLAIFMCTLVRKLMGVIAHRATRQAGQSTDLYVCVTLMGVLASGFCTDAVGVHAILGPFMLGLVLPKDNPFPKMIIEKIEDFVTGLFLPLFFALSGLKTNLGTLHGISSLGFLVLFFCVAAFGKIIASFITARFIGLPNRRALILSFLLNTKGLAVLIVLNIGRDLKVLSDELFAILVLTALLTSFVTTPVVTALCKGGNFEEGGSTTTSSSSCNPGSTHRTSQTTAHRSLASLAAAASAHNAASLIKKASHAQLRILACSFAEPRDHASFINLLEASRGCKHSPLKLYPLKLSLLSERPSALFLLTPPSPPPTLPIPLSFPASPSLCKVTIHPLSSVSDLDSMHSDICNLAVQKRTALILLPYHRPSSTHITSMFSEPSFSKVTQKVLDHAPCSVGLLVDRGSMGISPIHPLFFSYKVVVLFVGGPDDREALFLGSRMINHPGVSLRVVRFVGSTHPDPLTNNNLQANNNNIYSYDEVDEQVPPVPRVGEQFKVDFEGAKERLLDDEAMCEVKEKAAESSYVYEEEHVANGQSLGEAVCALTKQMNEVNMFIMGRGRMRPKLNTNSTCHEQSMHQQDEQLSDLGVIGDVLASSNSPEFHACILVVQQHVATHESKDTNGKVVSRTPSFTKPSSPSFEIIPIA